MTNNDNHDHTFGPINTTELHQVRITAHHGEQRLQRHVGSLWQRHAGLLVRLQADLLEKVLLPLRIALHDGIDDIGGHTFAFPPLGYEATMLVLNATSVVGRYVARQTLQARQLLSPTGDVDLALERSQRA